MANQTVTLAQLETGLRRRTADTDTELYGDFEYPINRLGEETNEICEALNEAQIFVACDIYDPDTYPFFRLQEVFVGWVKHSEPNAFLSSGGFKSLGFRRWLNPIYKS